MGSIQGNNDRNRSDAHLSGEGGPMNSIAIHSTIAAVAFLASTLSIEAQGTSGSTGAVASIPSSVVRAEPGQPPQLGLIGILTSPTTPGRDTDSNQRITRRAKNPLPQK